MKNILLIASLLVSLEALSQALETKVIIRAQAKDAKFIGSSMGGAQVTIRNTDTGELLAEGLITGNTGNTDLIMRTAHERGKLLSDDQTAKFEAIIYLEKPVLSTVEVLAPLGQRQSAIKASTQVWLIPGKHILGDGVVLEIPGFVVDIQDPGIQTFTKLNENGSTTLNLRAHIVMMCGCTLTKGGLWDADQYEVAAIVQHQGKEINRKSLKLSSDNQFETELTVREKGIYEITVYAYDPKTGNTGLDRTTFVVQ